MVARPSLKFLACAGFAGATVTLWAAAIKYILDHDDHKQSHRHHVPKIINCQKLPASSLTEEELDYCHHRYNFAVYTATH